MKSLTRYFNCGNVYLRGDALDLKVQKFEDLINKIIPFFQLYPILGAKSKYFDDLCKVASIIKNNEHLTEHGIEKIKNQSLNEYWKKMRLKITNL